MTVRAEMLPEGQNKVSIVLVRSLWRVGVLRNNEEQNRLSSQDGQFRCERLTVSAARHRR
jgi:hypothetical protein